MHRWCPWRALRNHGKRAGACEGHNAKSRSGDDLGEAERVTAEVNAQQWHPANSSGAGTGSRSTTDVQSIAFTPTDWKSVVRLGPAPAKYNAGEFCRAGSCLSSWKFEDPRVPLRACPAVPFDSQPQASGGRDQPRPRVALDRFRRQRSRAPGAVRSSQENLQDQMDRSAFIRLPCRVSTASLQALSFYATRTIGISREYGTTTRVADQKMSVSKAGAWSMRF